mmetsp:Transcript_107674/g.309960  ORF Transcript_107674/g.309960 Transcript_107674/m.309960 type:complete len:372 (+) Transcript_107674:51-1166(+)
MSEGKGGQTSTWDHRVQSSAESEPSHPRARGSRAQNSWRLVWCHEKCHKQECEALRSTLAQVSAQFGASFTCLKKAKTFDTWCQRAQRDPFVLLTDGREVKPCMEVVRRPDNRNVPLLTVVLSEQPKHAGRVAIWARSLPPPFRVCLIRDVSELSPWLLSASEHVRRLEVTALRPEISLATLCPPPPMSPTPRPSAQQLQQPQQQRPPQSQSSQNPPQSRQVDAPVVASLSAAAMPESAAGGASVGMLRLPDPPKLPLGTTQHQSPHAGSPEGKSTTSGSGSSPYSVTPSTASGNSPAPHSVYQGSPGFGSVQMAPQGAIVAMMPPQVMPMISQGNPGGCGHMVPFFVPQGSMGVVWQAGTPPPWTSAPTS